MVGGDPSITDYYSANGPPFAVSTEHVSAYSHADFDLTSSITLSAELGYAKVNGGPPGSHPRPDATGPLHDHPDNAYPTPDSAARIDESGQHPAGNASVSPCIYRWSTHNL